MRLKPSFARALLAAGLAACAASAQAANILHDLSAGSSWRTTLDGLEASQWALGVLPIGGVAATAPYSNSATTSLNANRTMWACGAGGVLCPGGGEAGEGPTEAFFAQEIFIDPGSTATGALSIIADDYVDLVVNGVSVLTTTLDANKDPSGQPVPVTVNLTPHLREGRNIFAIRAIDGYLESAAACALRGAGFEVVSIQPSLGGEFCKGNRGNEYVFLSGSVIEMDEPASLALASLALLAAGLGRRRR